jgi:hypothetical protein
MPCPADALQPVSLLEISRVLEETARMLRRHAWAACELPGDDRAAVRAVDVRAVIAIRQLRARYLGIEATDAAWSLMLERYAARLEGRNLSQTRLGVLAGVPETTTLRVTRRMLELGVFISCPHPTDRRLLVIELSEEIANRITTYLAATGALAGLAA